VVKRFILLFTGGESDYIQRKSILLVPLLACTCCSPRDFLSRRLATDLISASEAFRSPQQFVLETGVLSTKDYPAPEYLVLEHRGWISTNNAPCPAGLAPPCLEVLLTPSGVETVRALIPVADATKPSFTIPAARRELLAVTAISKQGNVAEVDFLWRWAPLNEIGAALYSADLRYKSSVGFRKYDDGWHLVESTPHPEQSIDDALKNAEPAP
jgi:hypothetical protein